MMSRWTFSWRSSAVLYAVSLATTAAALIFAALAHAQPVPPVCDRTPQVRDGILEKISGVSDCAEVTDSHLSGITGALSLANITVGTLKAGDFSGLGKLTNLGLKNTQLSTLTAAVFSGLGKLTNLGLRNNDLSTLPADVFSGLGNLEQLVLAGNQLTALPPGIFSGLANLQGLNIMGNDLTALPPGTFSGLSNLGLLQLSNNPGAPFRLTLRLEPADEATNVNLKRLTDLLSANTLAMVKLTLREGAPYPLAFSLTASGVGLSTDSVTIPAGGTQSETFTMTRIMDGNPVRITFSEPPSPTHDCDTDRRDSGRCFTGFEIVHDRTGPRATTIRFASAPQNPNGYVEGDKINVDVVFDRELVIDPPITTGSSSPTLALQIGADRRTAAYVVESNALAGILSFVYVVGAEDSDDNGVSVARNGLELNGAIITDVFNSPVTVELEEGLLVDFPEQKVQAFPTISFEESEIQADEGATVNAVFNFSTAVAMPTTVRYALTPGTATTDDYVDVAGSGEVVVPEGESSGTIQIFIVDDDIIERMRDRFSLTLVGSDGYALGSPTEIEVVIREGVCDRTGIVRGLFRNVFPGANHCSDITSAPGFGTVRVNRESISALKKDDFTDQNLNRIPLSSLEISENPRLTTLPAGLFSARLEHLLLQDNALAALPEELFAGLVNLGRLWLHDNELTTLPEGVFAGLGSLDTLRLHDNELTTLPEGVFAGLGSLELLTLNDNQLTALPENLFAGLDRLEQLWLHHNRFTTLPEKPFAGLVNLQRLRLDGNELTTLPEGAFSGLSSLRSLQLHGNPGAPFRLALGLEPADEAANVNPERLASLLSANTPATVKLTLREGAPYPLTLALTASGVELSTHSATIPTGSTQSVVFTATRNTNEDRVRVDISEPPPPPNDCVDGWKHEEQCFTGFEIVGGPIIDFVYDGMAPQVSTIRFASAPQDSQDLGGYDEGEVIKVDVVFDRGLAISPITEGSSSPTLALQIGADRRTATYVVGSNVAAGILSFVYEVRIGDFDDNGVSVARDGLELNGATVTDAVSNVPANLGVNDFLVDFPEQQVRAFPTISFEDNDIRPAEGETMNAVFNFSDAVAMPTTVRYALDPGTADAADYVAGSGEVVVPEGATSGTIRIPIVDDNIIERVRDRFRLDLVDSEGYELGSPTRIEVRIKEGVCDRTLPVAEAIRKARGQSHCSGVSNVNPITTLALQGESVSMYRKDDFANNDLKTLSLRSLAISGHPRLTALPVGVYSNNLRQLQLYDNALVALPENLFAGLNNLLRLRLHGNRLTALPPGAFSGLSSLRSLQLHDNPGAPFRLALGLEPTDEAPNVNPERLSSLLSTFEPATVKLTLREGAPYRLAFDLTASGVELSADSVTIPAGNTQSEMFTMTRITGDNRVTIALSEPPSPPNDCQSHWKYQGQCFTGFEIVGGPIIDFVYTQVTPQATTIRFASTPQDPEGYVEGEVIQVDVIFDRGLAISPITEGSSSPTLALQIGADRRTATYVVGSNAAAGILSFVYAVTAGDLDDNGVSVARDGLELNGATVTDAVFINDPANLGVNDFLVDFPEQKVRAFPTISFEESEIQADEGATVNAVFNFSAAVEMPTTVRYRLTPGTADAADYMDVTGNGEVVVPEGETSGTIRIFIVDDDIIERMRDRFRLTLVDPDGYTLGSPTEIEVVIREGVCDRTPQVAEAIRQLGGQSHCSDVSDTRSITRLSIVNNRGLTTLKARDFLYLDRLVDLYLFNNRLTMLPAPAGVFAGVGNLRRLRLDSNRLTTFPAGIFDNLGRLEELWLRHNELTTLPEGIFNKLGSVLRLPLNDNRLTMLPEGTFSGLSSLRSLQLHDNPGAPFRLTLGLEPFDKTQELAKLLEGTGAVMVELTLHEGAPYPLTLALTASGVQLSANQVMIPAGSTQSVAFTAARIAGQNQVRIALSEPPPPNDCVEGWKRQGQCFTGFEIVGGPTINFVYDGMAPQVTTIRFTSTPQAPNRYRQGETIKVDVVFDRGLVIPPIMEGDSSPTLALQIGANRRTATYVVESNAGAGVLSFVYRVTAEDFDENGVSVVQDGLELNGVSVTEPVGDLDANVNVDRFLADFPGHKVAGNLPSVSFEESEIRPAEGETINAVFNLDVAVAMPTTVLYALTPDTADADDYEASSGEVVVPESETSGTIQIFIRDDDIIERARETFSLNLLDSDDYALGSPTRIEISIREGVCDRTPQVQDAILGRLSSVDDCADVTDGDLSGIRRNLPLDNKSITSLKEKDFSGLTSLEELRLQDNDLRGTLSANLFAGLQALRTLRLQNNQVSTLLASTFNGLRNLQTINLEGNELTQLPDDIFADNGNLQTLNLGSNRLRELPEQVFFGFPQMRDLALHGNRLTELPAGAFPGYEFLSWLRFSDNLLESLPPGVFSDLESVTWLRFFNNRLTALPPGVFSGPLSNLRALTLDGNPGEPFQLKLRLEFAGEEQAPTLTDDPVVLRATLREGAPYALAIELQATHGTLSTTEVTIEAGSTRSGTFTVTRLQGENSVATSFAGVSPPPPPSNCASWQRRGGQCFSGFEIVSDAEFVLDDQPLSAVSGVAITSAPLAGDTYAAGDPNEEIVVELEFSGEIDVVQANDGSWPSLALAVGDETRFAVYDEAESSTDKLVFRYKPQAADVDDDGISVPVGALHLNGALILDAGVPVPLSSLSLGTRAIRNAPNHKVNVRNPRLSFEPAAVVLRAGGLSEVVALTLERNDLLQPGETVVVTLTPSQGLEVTSESGKSLTMVTLGRGVEATTRIRVSANRDAADPESLSATTSALLGDSRVAETTLRVTVAQREIRVLFEPGRILMVRGGAAAEMTSSAVTMRTEPELQGDEALVISLSADGVRLVSPTGPVRLTPANNAVTVTLEATRPLSALGAVSATLDENASSFGNARVTTEVLAVEVVRGVNLLLSGLVDQDSVRFAAGETTEVRVTTDPVLEGDERVTVTVSVDPDLSLESAGSALIDGNKLVLSAMNPSATVAVATDTPDLNLANGVSASGAGENVGVVGELPSLQVITDAVDEVTLVLSPPVVEVQQGGKALLRVTTVPQLGMHQRTWVTLMIEPADAGFSFVTDRKYFFRNASSSTMTVLLSRGQPILEIDVVSASDAVIGNTAQVVPSSMFDNRGVEVNVDRQSRVTLEATTPQVAIRFDPAPLVLRLNTDKRVTLGFDDDFMLRDSQTAELEVSVEGAGLSLQGGTPNLQVSLNANNMTAEVTVSAAANAAPVGRLVVRPVGGVELMGGMETASLPIEAQQSVRLGFEPDVVEIPRSRSTQFEVKIDPPLAADRGMTVTLEISAQDFAQGFAFGGGRTQHEVTFGAGKSRETVTVEATAARGSMASVSVAATRTSSGVDLATTPTLRLTVTEEALGTTLRIRVFLEGALE